MTPSSHGPTADPTAEALWALLPEDGSTLGNRAARQQLELGLRREVPEEEFVMARDVLVADGRVAKAKGRGGALRRVVTDTRSDAASKDTKVDESQKPVSAYEHKDRRANNPPVGLVTPDTDPSETKKVWAYDPHLDPELRFDVGRAEVEGIIDDALASGEEVVMRGALERLKRLQEPYLTWTGKAERTSFEVDTVSLHVHERIDPRTILEAVRKRQAEGPAKPEERQLDLFAPPFEELPLAKDLEFFQHEKGWANRLIAGDSLLVMNSLLEKEGMAGKVQMIYMDPPYGIKYGSNFQPFVDRRDVKDRKDEDLTQEPEMVKAFRDTWELGIHSYISYLRDRLVVARELLHLSGSLFFQISSDNLSLCSELLAAVFGRQNLAAVIPFKKNNRRGELRRWHKSPAIDLRLYNLVRAGPKGNQNKPAIQDQRC